MVIDIALGIALGAWIVGDYEPSLFFGVILILTVVLEIFAGVAKVVKGG